MAQVQASKAAAAASEQAAKYQSTDAFAFASNAFAEIKANTVAAAEAAEGNLRHFMENDEEKARAQALEEVTPEAGWCRLDPPGVEGSWFQCLKLIKHDVMKPLACAFKRCFPISTWCTPTPRRSGSRRTSWSSSAAGPDNTLPLFS